MLQASDAKGCLKKSADLRDPSETSYGTTIVASKIGKGCFAAVNSNGMRIISEVGDLHFNAHEATSFQSVVGVSLLLVRA